MNPFLFKRMIEFNPGKECIASSAPPTAIQHTLCFPPFNQFTIDLLSALMNPLKSKISLANGIKKFRLSVHNLTFNLWNCVLKLVVKDAKWAQWAYPFSINHDRGEVWYQVYHEDEVQKWKDHHQVTLFLWLQATYSRWYSVARWIDQFWTLIYQYLSKVSCQCISKQDRSK